jgi:hypothetical protein
MKNFIRDNFCAYFIYLELLDKFLTTIKRYVRYLSHLPAPCSNTALLVSLKQDSPKPGVKLIALALTAKRWFLPVGL